MMREILFRGKRKDNGEWVEGNLFAPDEAKHRKAPTEILVGTNIVRISWEVDPETVGQYTGLKDKNGKRIFEGDILSILFEEDRSPYEENSIYYEKGEVYFDNNIRFDRSSCDLCQSS